MSVALSRLPAKPLLELHDLDVEIPLEDGTLHAVRGVSLTASAGQSVGLVGESGSGKSLTLRAAMDLLPVPARITGGTVVVDGVDVTGMTPARRREHLSSVLAMIFQDSLTALNPTMRVGDQVAEVPRLRLGMSRSAAHDRAVDLLRQVGIRDPERRYRSFPHELSGGMRQRVCIAIALSAEPGLILADEPTTALDVTIQAQVLGVLESLRQDRGVGMVLVTHDLAVVSGTCEELNVMYAGRIVEHGRTDVLLDAPRHPYTAALLRSVPDPDQPVHRLLTITGQPPDLMQPIAGCPFAPRCPAVVDRCVQERPPLSGVGQLPGQARHSSFVPASGGFGHTSACWRSHEPERWPTGIADAALYGTDRTVDEAGTGEVWR
jgi:oligopeptide/dipeptide ABC transporter ATP-binding protein